MNTYLGYTIIDKPYCNFYPTHEYVNNQFIKIDDATSRFPTYGNFTVYNLNKFSKIEDTFANKEFCIINIFPEDVEIIEGATSKYRLLVTEASKKKIKRLNSHKIYPIVTPKDASTDFASSERIMINESFPSLKYMPEVVLYFNEEHYGPFPIGYRSYDDTFYIITNIKDNNFLIPKLVCQSDDIDPILYYSGHGKIEQDFYHISDNISIEPVDIATKDVLVEALINASKTYQQGFSKGIDKESLKKIITAIQITTADPKISEKRKEWLETVQNDMSLFLHYSDLSSEMLKQVFLSPNISNKNEIINKLLDDVHFMNGIQSHKIIVRKIEEQKEISKQLEREVELKKQDLEMHRQQLENELLKGKKEELAHIEQCIAESQERLEEIQQLLNLAQSIEELTKQKHRLLLEIQVASENRDSMLVEKEKLMHSISEAIKEAENSISTINFKNEFNKLIFENFSSAATQEIAELNRQNYQKISNEISKIKTTHLEPADLINKVVKKVQTVRPNYSRNDIINICICLTQNFLTIFAGSPGTGKTSICKILGNALGLDNQLVESSSINTQRFLTMPVEKGWTSKKDFIGYYNPLSKTVEKNSSALYDLLSLLNAENDKSNLPAIVLLDEANMSTMEYYWSDFIHVCDNFEAKNSIDLGGEHILNIPSTLRFLATTNNDHTVETLSPRLIDRAFVISLPENGYVYTGAPLSEKLTAEDIVSMSSLREAFCAKGREVENEACIVLEHIDEQMKKMNHPISPRVKNQIHNYCAVAQDLFESSNGIAASIIATDYAVLQKILPSINGFGEHYKQELEALYNLCEKNNLLMSAQKVSKILSYKEDDSIIQSYSFFD